MASPDMEFSEVDLPNISEDDEALLLSTSAAKGISSMDSLGSSRTSWNTRRLRQNDTPDTREPSRPTSKLEEQITNESLKRLQKMFEEADEDGGGGLDIEEFTKAMQKTMPGLDERELQLIFMKVDTNCDGTVDWDEYLSYMLLEYKEKDQMTSLMQDKPFPKPLRDIPSSHRDDIADVRFIPTLNRRDHWVDGIDYQCGRYVSVSKEGIINFWSIDMHHIKSHVLQYAKESTLWITAMVPMPNLNMLAIASTEREIAFFDINANKFDRQYRITGLEDCVLNMDFWFNNRNTNEAVLVWGDVGGSISAMLFSECMTGGSLFGNRHKSSRHSDNGRRIAFAELLIGNVKGIQAHKLKRVHLDWVCQVKYFHTLDCFISCSASGPTCMYMGDFQRRKTGYYFNSRKGILCFDYCKTSNIIVTGGMDHLVRVWNPYVTAKSIVVLKGHVKAVIHVIINSRREQIISVAKDKAIRVFNMADQSCAQYIPGHKIPMGTHIIGSALFNPVTQTLLLASNQLAILEKGNEDRQVEISSHNAPVCAALYNKLFGQIVSACLESMVCVWDVSTGEKLIQFTNAHCSITTGEIIPIEITAMTFDPTGRRLITGARDGSLKIWNFNNGACLRELMTHGGLEITGIVCPRDRIVVTGWNRRVTIYMDAKHMEDEIPRIWNARHEEDIQALAFNGTSNLATSSYDGDILLWSIETSQPLCKMNAYISSKPLTSTGQMKLRPKHRKQVISKLDPRLTEMDDSSSVTTQSTERKVKTARATRDVKAEDARETSSARTTSSPRGGQERQPQADECDTSIDKLVFLTQRENDIATATILSGGADGWIRAWCIHHKGGLLGQFIGAHNPGASISAMVVDEKNELLISGDTKGYVKTWDISDYCISSAQLDRLIPITERLGRQEQRRKNFSFPVFHKILKTLPKFRFNAKRFAKPPEQSDPERTIKEPFLLNSYRAHVKPITHIELLEDRALVATSSVDCSIRMWTLQGRFIGTFGQAKPWDIKHEGVVEDSQLPVTVPTDISRVASTATLQVLNPRQRNHWTFAKNILMLASKLSKKNRTGMSMGDAETEEEVAATPDEVGEAEPILGKYYHSRVRHKMMPKLPPIKHCHNQVSVYSSLPFSELLPIQQDRTVNRIIYRHRSFNPTVPTERPDVSPKFGPKIRGVMARQKLVKVFNQEGENRRRRLSSLVPPSGATSPRFAAALSGGNRLSIIPQ